MQNIFANLRIENDKYQFLNVHKSGNNWKNKKFIEFITCKYAIILKLLYSPLHTIKTQVNGTHIKSVLK